MNMKDYLAKVEDFETYSEGLYALLERYELGDAFPKEVVKALIESTFPNVEDNSVVLMASTIDEGDEATWDEVVKKLMSADTETDIVISSMLAKVIAALTQYEAVLSLVSDVFNQVRERD